MAMNVNSVGYNPLQGNGPTGNAYRMQQQQKQQAMTPDGNGAMNRALQPMKAPPEEGKGDVIDTMG